MGKYLAQKQTLIKIQISSYKSEMEFLMAFFIYIVQSTPLIKKHMP